MATAGNDARCRNRCARRAEAIRHPGGTSPGTANLTIRSLEAIGDLDCAGRVVIVGAGAVGIAMAVALSRRGKRVTLIEGGPRHPPADFEARNAGRNIGREHGGLRSGRMQALGGTTLLWGGQLVPFDAGDFGAHDEHGARLWPISHEEVATWIERAYELLGVPEEARHTRAIWEEATGRSALLGNSLFATMNIWLGQPDFTRLFARELERSRLIEVITDARLTELGFDADGAVDRVVVEAPSGRSVTLSPGPLVLANGTIEIVRTLLLAQRDPACPFAQNTHVGRWFMDHLHGLAGTLEVTDRQQVARLFDTIYRGGLKYTVKVRLASEGREPGAPNIAATLNPALTIGEIARETLALARRAISGRSSPIAALVEGARAVRVVAPAAWRYLRHRRAAGLYASAVQIGLEVEQQPSRASRIVLDGDDLVLDWRVERGEVAAMAPFLERLAGAFAENGLGTITPDPRVLAGDDRILDAFHDAYHHLGGARMAAGAADGVVDAGGRVFGTANLHVAGAATFPSGSFANPTLTAIALGLRLADTLSADHATAPRFVDRLVFGTARLAGGVSSRSAAALLDTVFDAGVRRIDSAPPYGVSTAEDVIGRVLRRRGDADDITIIAKVGLPRARYGLAKTALRAVRRAFSRPPARRYDTWAPEAPRPGVGDGSFGAEIMARSVAISRRKLGRFDYLLLHECSADEHGGAVAEAIGRLADAHGAEPGYGWGAYFDAALDACFPPHYLAECAIPPELLRGAVLPPKRRAVFHSIVPTAEYLSRTDPAFAELMAVTEALFVDSDRASARIAAAYAIAAARAPEAWLVFSSTRRDHVTGLLTAFAEIDSRGIADRVRRIAC